MQSLFQSRVTGILIEEGKILLVKQKVSPSRMWSLPGGRLERGETLETGIIREMKEETGLDIAVKGLLYVCDKPDADPPLVHITFLLKRLSGELQIPSNEHVSNPILDLAMVDIDDLVAYGFSPRFQALVRNGFPNAGSNQGAKSSIGL